MCTLLNLIPTKWRASLTLQTFQACHNWVWSVWLLAPVTKGITDFVSSLLLVASSINFYFTPLLLIHILLDDSTFLPAKLGISSATLKQSRNFKDPPEIPGMLQIPDSLKCYSSFRSNWIILNFTRETRHVVPPYNKARISNIYLELQEFYKFCQSYFIIWMCDH